MNEQLQKLVNKIFLKIEDGIIDLDEGRLEIIRAFELYAE